MDVPAVRVAFDRQLRREARPGPGGSVERDAHVTRLLGPGWRGVVWSDLSADDVDEVIAREVTRLAGEPWEWKHYSGDRPDDLPRRLLAAGFLADPPETVMVAEVADLDLVPAPPAGVQILTVTSSQDVQALVCLHDEVFGGDHASVGQEVMDALDVAEPPVVAVLARVGDAVVAGGRIEFHGGTDFASIWGGGTLRQWRGRGVFRALVARRAALAAERGFRYLQVDALPTSRPVLARLGFAEIATTTPYRR